ncbi:MAG: hypothetical protein FJ118_02365 [Deltaproteobacteria bacterium]|nr:hypothetical protein [Deltaproteobacteria bacterium]
MYPVCVGGKLFLRADSVLLVILLLAAAWMVSAPSGVSHAQSPAIAEAYLVGIKKSDRVGKDQAYPDGKPDAVFALSFQEVPAGQKITEIEIRTAAGPKGVWNTKAKRPSSGFVGIADARRPSALLNQTGKPLNLDPREFRSLLLFVTDDDHFEDRSRTYTVTITRSDRSASTIPVRPEPTSAKEPEPSAAGAFPVRMSALLKGISDYDAVNPGKTIGGDDKADGLFVLTVEATDRDIVAIQIRNVDGTPSAWDTVPGSKNGAVGVALVSDPIRLVNSKEGSVRIKVKDKVDLNLYVADNGSIQEGKTNYRVAVTFSDGQVAWCPVKKGAPKREDSETKPAEQAQVNFLGSWLGFVSTDAVGKHPGLKPDNAADAVFGLDIEVTPRNTIRGIEIQNLIDPGQRWGTTGTTAGAWGLGVAYQSAPRSLLNRQDGSVNIPIYGREQFLIYAADPGDFAKESGNLRLVVHMGDGSSFQQLIRRPPATTPTVAPQTTDLTKAQGLLTCEFRGFIADIVNQSNKPGKDGYLDGTFIAKLRETEKKIASIAISGPDGVARWSSQPKPPAMFLGVALYPKIYNLVNLKGGPLDIPVAGRRTLYLYAADNGMLADPNSILRITVTFTDKSQLAAEVIK